MKIRSFIKLCAKIYKTKAAKVALLGVCSTMLLVSSGASFAKYYSENGFGDGATMAKIGDAKLYYDYIRIQTPSAMEPTKDYGYYAFMASFRIEFSDSEVKRNYNLDLRLTKMPNENYEYIDYPTLTSFTLDNDAASTTIDTFKTTVNNGVATASIISPVLANSNTDEKWKELKTALNISTFSADTVYYATGQAKAGENVTYNWVAQSVNTVFTNNNVQIATNKDLLMEANLIHYYKIVYFVNFKLVNGSLTNENTRILYNLTMNQVQK